ncbi:hypothetical protein FH972_004688 [Carpinus fangiana]|uniref:NFP third LysM domain-containing protein n=1 Tax=Carpinus fangiana TaxID=176857 RepID=A0A5N6QNT6_9ROSI|nr:hypothetical protein FH972_004688 [Carpinus fangiana]
MDWQPNDDVLQVSATLNASPTAIGAENGNFSSTVFVFIIIHDLSGGTNVVCRLPSSEDGFAVATAGERLLWLPCC